MEPIITIQEEYSLPSKGKLYSIMFNPIIKFRSMTVAEEMKRLSHTETPYKTMCEIIDSCIISNKLPISSYDMCIGDYQYLIHKLRTVTYGPEYPVSTVCPHCGKAFDFIINLDELEVHEYNEDLEDKLNIRLSNDDVIKLRLQTPRDLDDIAKRIKVHNKLHGQDEDVTMLYNMETFIDSINGETLPIEDKLDYIRNMPMADSLKLINRANELNDCIGVDISIKTECTHCKKDVVSSFRYTTEFFRPRV